MILHLTTTTTTTKHDYLIYYDHNHAIIILLYSMWAIFKTSLEIIKSLENSMLYYYDSKQDSVKNYNRFRAMSNEYKKMIPL